MLQIARDKLITRLSVQKENVGGGNTAYVDRSSFIGDLKKVAIQEGLGPTADLATTPTPGSLKDISSARRLGLIYDMQVQSAQGYARWKMGQDPDSIDAFPAQELIRLEDRENKRDWTSRWINAGGELTAGRMIALKTDPIWENISAFGSPWPPYDYGSGMGVEIVSRSEAEALGIIEPGQLLEPSEKRFNDDLEASVSDLAPEYQKYIKDIFGDQIQINAEGQAKWQGNLIADFVKTALSNPEAKKTIDIGLATAKTIAKSQTAGTDLTGYNLHLQSDYVRHSMNRHGKTEKRQDQTPIKPSDYELIPFVWREPDEVQPGTSPASLIFKKKIDGTLVFVEWVKSEQRKTLKMTTLWKKKDG